MKFDYAIGNPAYQAEFTLEGNKTYAAPVYNKFMDAAAEVADKVELIHPARFLFNAGSTPKAWNDKMLNSVHFKVLCYEEDASKVFPTTDIKGGIAITYQDSKKTFEPILVFTKYPELNSIEPKLPLQLLVRRTRIQKCLSTFGRHADLAISFRAIFTVKIVHTLPFLPNRYLAINGMMNL